MRRALDALLRLLFTCAYRAHLFWNLLFRPTHHGVWIAVWSGGKLLLIRNSYRSCITLPGGGQESGESLPGAAQRELREEVGIRVKPEALILWGEYLSLVEYKYDHINLFELQLDHMPEIVLDHREVVWSAFCSPAEALAMNLFPALRTYLEDKQAGRRPAVRGGGRDEGQDWDRPQAPGSVGAARQQNGGHGPQQ